MSSLLTALCLLATVGTTGAPDSIVLTPKKPGTGVHEAARLVGDWGKVAAREGASYRIELKPGVSVEAAQKKLGAQGAFAFKVSRKPEPKLPSVIKRMEWEASIRRDAKGELDWESLNREAQHLKQMPMADLYGAYRPLGPTGNWQYIGPRDLFVPYQSFFGSRGISGRVNGVAYDPNNTNTIYAASSSGGLRKSTDGGTTWQFMSATWDMLHTSCVAVDPRPNNTIYVGTGDYQGSFGGQIQLANGRGYGMGIMKSTDGGQTWVNAVKTSSRAAFGNVAVSKILIVPEAPDTLIVTTGRGQGGFGRVFVSPDGGTTWNPARTASGADLPLAAWGGLAMSIPNGAGARSIYAVAAQPAPRIYRSTDRGATWTSLGAPLTPPSASANFDVACSSFDPNRLYLLSSNYTADNNGNVTSSGDVLVSTNSGGAWSTIANTFSGAWNQAFYNYHITVAPWTDSGNVQRDCVYVGQVDLFASKTGTDSWTSIGLTTTEDAKTHNDQHAMAINPSNPNEALVANDGGVYRLVHNRQTDSVQFTNLSGKLDITEFYSIASHPDNEVRIMGGTQDNGTPSTPLAALSWNDASYWVSLPSGGDGGPCFFAENHSASRYASNNNLRVHKSHNGGQNWEEFSLRTGGTNQNPIFWNGEPTAWQAPFTIDQNQHQYIYAGSSFLYRYNLQTLQWTRFNVTFTNTQGEVLSAITIPRGQSDIIYVGTSLGKVFVSRNFGANWTRIDTPTIAGVNISHIEAHPTNPNQVLISQTALNRKNLYRCADTSAPIAWSDVNGPDGATDPARALRAPIHDIVMDPENPGSVWYAATDLGVIMTRTGGASWTNLTTPYGLPNVQVSDIDFNRTTRYMTIGTYGYGAWRIQVPATSVTLTYPNDEVPQGGSAIGTVTVSEPAPAGGTPVSLTANHTGVTFSSSTVTVPSGSTTASVTTNFAATIPHNTYVTVTATLGGSTSSKTLVVRVPKLRSIFLFMAETYGGSTNVPGTVSLQQQNFEGDKVITMTSSHPTVASIPASATIGYSYNSASFNVTTYLVSTAQTVTFTATLEGFSKTVQLLVKPNRLNAITPESNPSDSGRSTYLHVQADAVAPPPGIPVTLSTDNPEYFTSFPTSATIARPESTVLVEVSNKRTNVDLQTTVRATANGSTVTSIYKIWSPRPGHVLATSPIVGGATGTVTTIFSGTAESTAGVTFNLSSNSSVIVVPATDTLAAGTSTKQTPFSTLPVTAQVTKTITVTRAGVSKTVNVTLTPGGLLSASVNPSTIVGGASTNGFVRLSGPAPTGGTTITMTTSSSALSVPASVTVPAGADSVGFPVNTTPVTADVQRYFEARLDTVTRRAYVNLTSAGIQNFTISPDNVVGGVNTNGFIRLSSAAPAGGRTINLSSNSASVVVPATMTVPEGQIVSAFPIVTKPVGSTVQRVVYASYGGVSKHAVITLTPAPASVTGLAFNPPTVTGGQPSTGTVTLSNAAPTGGIVVNLSSSSSAIQVPASVTVAAGQSTANFTANTSAVTATATRSVTASYAGSSKAANLTLNPAPPALTSLALSPNSVTGGQSTTGTVTLTSAAPAGGIVVTLSSNSSAIQVPASVTVAAGQTTATFTITTSRVAASATRTVSATYSGVTKNANLTLNP